MTQTRLSPIQITKGVIAVLIGFLIATPLLYGLSMSVLPNNEIVAYPPKLFPNTVTLENYINVFKSVPILRFILNSFIVCVCVVALQVLTSSLAAYAFVFYDFKYKNIIFIAILATMMIPGEAIIISNYLTISSWKLLDSYVGLILPFGASAMGTFLMRQNYLTIPKELKEASSVDGCSELRFFVSILFPVSMPAVVALSVYVFINTWNQYMWPLLITNSDKMRTVQIGISMLQFSDGLAFGQIMAGFIIILIPSIIIFVFGGQKMIGGITAGAVKG